MKKSSEPTVIFRHADFLLVDKPAGWAVQGTDQDLVNYYAKRQKREVHVVNRLDQPVSGLTLLARSPKAAARLTNIQASGGIQKKYVAIVESVITQDHMDIVFPLAKKGQKAILDEQGNEAITHADVVWRGDRYTGLVIECETGRFHQIRAHLSAIGHAIKGDLKYGAKRSEKEGGIYLHCFSFQFQYPDYPGETRVAPPEQKSLFQMLPSSLFSTEGVNLPMDGEDEGNIPG